MQVPPSTSGHLVFSSNTMQSHATEVQQILMMQGQQVMAGHHLFLPGHELVLLHQAKLLCDQQDYVDLTFYCEDGVVRAHQMLLAVASPFLKILFQTHKKQSPIYELEDISIILPDTTVCLVQALIHFIYTGYVVTNEEIFYSLMKLIYSLNINVSIEGESTQEWPTVLSTPLALICNSCVTHRYNGCHTNPVV